MQKWGFLRCYLYDLEVREVEDKRCENKDECIGCIFVVRGEEDGKEKVWQ